MPDESRDNQTQPESEADESRSTDSLPMNSHRARLFKLHASLLHWKKWDSFQLIQRIARSPAMMLFFGVIIGTCIASHLNSLRVWHALLVAILIIAGLAIFKWWRQERRYYLSLWIFGLAVILSAGWWSYRVHESTELFQSDSEAPILMDMRGVIVNRPIRRDKPNTAMAPIYREEPRFRWIMRIDEVFRDGRWIETNFKLQVGSLGLPEAMGPGSKLRFQGWVRPWPSTQNPGEFDYGRYMQDRGVLGRVFVSEPMLFEVERSPKGLMNQWRWFRWRMAGWVGQRLERAWGEAAETEAASLLRLLILGEVPGVHRDLEVSFREAGLAHLLAISGLHLGLLALLCWGLCRLCGAGPRGAAWTTLILISFYAMLLADRTSITRSFLMMSALCIATGVGRRWSNSVVLCWVGLGLWVYEPAQIFNAGFQLSFGVVAGIMWLTPGLKDAMIQTFKIDPLQGWRSRVQLMMIDYVMVGLVAWMVSMPLVAFHFGQMKWFALLWGLLVTPFIMVLLILGFTQFLLVLIHPSLGAWLTGIIELFGTGIIQGTVWPKELGIYGWSFPKPSWWWAVLCLLLVSVFFLERRWIRRWPALLMGLVLISALWWPVWFWEWQSRDQVRISVMAVGDGNCYLIQHQGENWLYDAGSRSHLSAGRHSIIPVLRESGVARLDRVFISHPDSDHYNALLDIIQVIPVGEVWVTHRWFESLTDQRGVAFVHGELQRLGVPVRLTKMNQQWNLGQMTLTCLWPDATLESSPVVLEDNDTSMVLRLDFGGRRVLLTGDIENAAILALDQLHRETGKMKADVMEIPHHGAFTKESPTLLRLVRPKYTWASSGKIVKKRKVNWRALDPNVIDIYTARRGLVRLQIEEFGRIDWWTHREIDSVKDPQ